MAAFTSVAAYLSSRIWSSPTPVVELTVDQKLDKVRSGEWSLPNAGLIRYADELFNLRGNTPGGMVLPEEVKWQLFHAAHAYQEDRGGQKIIHLGTAFYFKHEKMNKPSELAILYRVLNSYRLKEIADYELARASQPTLERRIICEKHVYEMEYYFLHLNDEASWSSQDALDDFRRQLILELEVLADVNLSPIIHKLKSGSSPTIIFPKIDMVYGLFAINGIGASMPAGCDMLARNIKELTGSSLCPMLQTIDQEEESVLASSIEQRVEKTKEYVKSTKLAFGTLGVVAAVASSPVVTVVAVAAPWIAEKKPVLLCKDVAKARIQRLQIKIYTHLEPEIFRLMSLPPSPERDHQLYQLKIASRTFRQFMSYYGDLVPHVYR